MKPHKDPLPYEAFKNMPVTYATWIQGPWKHNTCVFKGIFYDKNGKKDGFVMVPDTFFSLHARRDCTLVFSLVGGLKDLYRLPAWGVDIKRSYELMTTITEDGHAHITNNDKEKATHTKLKELEKQLAIAQKAKEAYPEMPLPAPQPSTVQFEGSSWEAKHEDVTHAMTGLHNPEKDTTRATKPTMLDELTRTKHALQDQINQELEPLVKACIEWELRHVILHSANVYYLKLGDAIADTTLPLPLLKQEVIPDKKK